MNMAFLVLQHVNSVIPLPLRKWEADAD